MTTEDACAAMGHPGVTFNPWADKTWCICGSRTYPGDVTGNRHLACCGGPLTGLTRRAPEGTLL